jgi:hypothetical protein
MKAFKLVMTAFVAVLVALGLGFAWGSAGRGTAQGALDDLRQQLEIADARTHILEARVSLYNVNFGDAQRQLDDAKAPLTRARDRAQAQGGKAAADALTSALTRVQEAQRLAGRLDQNANSQANEALKAIQVAVGK